MRGSVSLKTVRNANKLTDTITECIKKDLKLCGSRTAKQDPEIEGLFLVYHTHRSAGKEEQKEEVEKGCRCGYRLTVLLHLLVRGVYHSCL